MSFLDKIRTSNGPQAPRQPGPRGIMHSGSPAVLAAMSHLPSVSAAGARTGRLSNGLKEFLLQLNGIGRGHLVGLGPARQTAITFCIERGFKVYTDDILSTWKLFQDGEELRKKELPPDADRSDLTPEAQVAKFLDNPLDYPEGTFDAVLLWDILDYLHPKLMGKLTAWLTSLVRDDGAVFVLFLASRPESFHLYRVVDAQHIEL